MHSTDILLKTLNKEGILRLTLNDVKRRNALSEAMLAALGAAFDEASDDPFPPQSCAPSQGVLYPGL